MRRLWTPGALVGLLALSIVGAQAAPADPEILTLDEAAALLRVEPAAVERMAAAQRIPARRVGTQWRFNRSTLLTWLAGDWKIQTLVDPATVLASAQAEVDEGRSGSSVPGTSGSGGRLPPPKTVTDGAANPARTAPPAPAVQLGVPSDQRSAADVFLRDQRILLSPRELTVDVGAFYTRRDDTILAVLNDQLVQADIESDVFTTQVVARYSLFSDTEVFARTSYSSQDVRIYAGAERLDRATRSEVGDIGAGVRHTFLDEGVGRPDVIGSLDVRIPTGDTSYAAGMALTLVKSVDPVVLFGTAGYRRTFSRDFSDLTRLEARDRFDLTLGYAFALNDTLSLNTSVLTTVTRAAQFDDAELRSSNRSTLQLGMTARVAKGVYLQPLLGYDLNGSGSGYTLGLNIPIGVSMPGD